MKFLETIKITIGVILLLGFISCAATAQDKEAQKMQKKVDPKMAEVAKASEPMAAEPTAVEFKSLDGLLISGNLYEIGEDKPVLLLCHQAGYNKAEYADIAPRLNEMGYNCLAIDQRSGGTFAEKPNETADRANAKGLPTQYVDAQQDIEAAIAYLNKKYNRKVIIWGSSYSSSLVLFESLKNDNVIASISFSPGDYFGNSKPSLSTVFSKLEKPFFVTSSKKEAVKIGELIDLGLSVETGKKQLKANQVQFIPTVAGFHGSKALWPGQKGAAEYWTAVTAFLKSI